MRIQSTLLHRILSFVTMLASSATISLVDPVQAQHITRHADGTVEVSDDETPAPAPKTYSSAATRKATSSSLKSSRASRGGRIPAYTKRMGGVTIKRHADGTIDVVDETENYSPARHSSTSTSSSRKRSGSSVGAYKRSYSDVSVKRNADGTVEVTDTSSTTRKK